MLNITNTFQGGKLEANFSENTFANQSEYDYEDYEDYYYEYDPTLIKISLGDMVVPLLVYSITFIIGLVGNSLILVAVRGQTQVGIYY